MIDVNDIDWDFWDLDDIFEDLANNDLFEEDDSDV